MGGPICHIPTDTPISQPSPVTFPSIPTPDGTLAGIMNTLLAMKMAIELLSGQNSHAPNRTSFVQGPPPAGAPRGGVKPPPKSSPQKPARWTESGRTTQKVRVFNPDDHNQFVDVLRINTLTLADGVTGESWFWARGGE